MFYVGFDIGVPSFGRKEKYRKKHIEVENDERLDTLLIV